MSCGIVYIVISKKKLCSIFNSLCSADGLLLPTQLNRGVNNWLKYQTSRLLSHVVQSKFVYKIQLRKTSFGFRINPEKIDAILGLTSRKPCESLYYSLSSDTFAFQKIDNRGRIGARARIVTIPYLDEGANRQAKTGFNFLC